MSCKLQVDPTKIKNQRDPIILGVTIQSGTLEVGDELCIPSKDYISIGKVSRITDEVFFLDKAIQGRNVIITIDSLVGDCPKCYMRHFDHTDIIEKRCEHNKLAADDTAVLQNDLNETVVA
jgi:translation initiation factor 5B